MKTDLCVYTASGSASADEDDSSFAPSHVLDGFSTSAKNIRNRRNRKLHKPFRRSAKQQLKDQKVINNESPSRLIYTEQRTLADSYSETELEAMDLEQKKTCLLQLLNVFHTHKSIEPLDDTLPILQHQESTSTRLKMHKDGYAFNPFKALASVLQECDGEEDPDNSFIRYYTRFVMFRNRSEALLANEEYRKDFPADCCFADVNRLEIERQEPDIPLFVPRSGQSISNTAYSREEDDRNSEERTRYTNYSAGKKVVVFEWLQLRRSVNGRFAWNQDRSLGDTELGLQADVRSLDSRIGGFIPRHILSQEQKELQIRISKFVSTPGSLLKYQDLIGKHSKSMKQEDLDPNRTTASVKAKIRSCMIDMAADSARREATGQREAYHAMYDERDANFANIISAPRPKTIPSQSVIDQIAMVSSSIPPLTSDQAVPIMIVAKDVTRLDLAGKTAVFASIAGEGPAMMAYSTLLAHGQPTSVEAMAASSSDDIASRFYPSSDFFAFTEWHICILPGVAHTSRLLYHMRPRIIIVQSSKIWNLFSLGVFGTWSIGAPPDLLESFLDDISSDRLDELLVAIVLVVILGPIILIIILWQDLPCNNWRDCTARPALVQVAPGIWCIACPSFDPGNFKRRAEAFHLIKSIDYHVTWTTDVLNYLAINIPCAYDRESQQAFLYICEEILQDLGITDSVEKDRRRMRDLDNAVWRLRITSANDREVARVGEEIAEERSLVLARKQAQAQAE